MTCQDIYNQVDQEWVRPVPKFSRAKLQIDANNTITITREFANEHDAKLAVLMAYCKAHGNMTAREIVAFVEGNLDKVVVE